MCSWSLFLLDNTVGSIHPGGGRNASGMPCIVLVIITNKNICGKKMKWDVGMMINRDVAEKRYKNKVGLSSY